MNDSDREYVKMIESPIIWEWASTPHPPYRAEYEGSVYYIFIDDDIDNFDQGILDYILYRESVYLTRVQDWPSLWKRPRGRPPFWDKGVLNWWIWKCKHVLKIH